MAGPWEAFQSAREAAGPWSAFQPKEQSKSLLEKAAEPITSYPETYQQMNQESRDLMGEGVRQVGEGGVGNVAIGAGKAALGGLGYVTSPINAALRTVVGKPVEENTGIPKEYTEFAAGMALPIPRIPGRVGKAAVPTEAELKVTAQAAYNSPEVQGLVIRPKPVSDWASLTKAKLTDMGFDPETPVYRILTRLESAPAGSAVTGNNLNNIRQRLGEAAANPDASIRKAASIAMESLDEFLPSVSAADTVRGNAAAAASKFSEARGNWSSLRQSERVTGKADVAELNAASANSGMNLENNLRTGVKQILKDPKQRRGLSEDVISQMDTFVRGGKISNAARTIANFLGGGGGLGALISEKLLGPVGPMAGYAFKKIGNVVASNKVEKIAEAIRAESPAGRAAANSVRDWGNASAAFEISNSTKNLARLTVASRNLTNNLKSLGIDATPEDLLRSGVNPSSPDSAIQEKGSPE